MVRQDEKGRRRREAARRIPGPVIPETLELREVPVSASNVEKGGTSRNGRVHTTLLTAIIRQAPLAHRRPGQTRDTQIAERPAQCHMSLRRGLERCVARCVVLGVHSACSTGCPTASMWWGLFPDGPGRACPWMGTSWHGMSYLCSLCCLRAAAAAASRPTHTPPPPHEPTSLRGRPPFGTPPSSHRCIHDPSLLASYSRPLLP